MMEYLLALLKQNFEGNDKNEGYGGKNKRGTILYRWKEKDLKETYRKKKDAKTIYATLQNAYTEATAASADSGAVNSYLNVLKEYRNKKESFIPAGKAVKSYWEQLLSAFPDPFEGKLTDNQRKALEELHEDCIYWYIIQQVNDKLKKNDQNTIDRELLELCEKEGLIRCGTADPVREHNENEEEKIHHYLRFLQSIYELKDESKKKEYERIFIPVLVDDYTGISLCIVGRSSYERYYDLRRELAEEITKQNTWDKLKDRNWAYMTCPFPCALTVLHFTDVGAGGLRASVMYETLTDFFEHMKVFDEYEFAEEADKEKRILVIQKYYYMVRKDYVDAIDKAQRDFDDINLFGEPYLEGYHEIAFIKNRGDEKAKQKARDIETRTEAEALRIKLETEFERRHPEPKKAG